MAGRRRGVIVVIVTIAIRQHILPFPVHIVIRKHVNGFDMFMDRNITPAIQAPIHTQNWTSMLVCSCSELHVA